MKFQIISDVHIETMDNPVKSFIDGKLWIPNANNLIICGNLGEVRQESYFLFLNEVKNHYKRVFIVLGDQEFFFCDIDTITDKIKDFCMYAPNVYFLNDTMYDFGKIVILGTTLWADVNLANSQHLSTKYQHIKKDKYNNPLSCKDTVDMHKKSVSWLEASLNLINQTEKKAIVCTHYPPIVNGISNPKLEKDTKNVGDATDLSNLMKFECIKSWVFGRTQCLVNSKINNINIISNPIGYKTEKIYYSPIRTITI